MKALLLPFLACLLALAQAASAQATRTWVSGVGDDANPGSRTAPCKTFAGAISKTAAGGVIDVLDPGGFGAVTITKSITINGGFAEGAILSTGTNAIIVNAGANDVVILRNLQIHSTSGTLSGVRILNAGAVYLENCRISGFATGVEEATGTATGTQVFLRNCFVLECGTAGVTLTPAEGAASVATLYQTRIQGCGSGLTVNPRATAYLHENIIALNAAHGIKRVAPGLIKSARNNRIFGNTPDGTANGTIPVK
jgi:hypothetical protein